MKFFEQDIWLWSGESDTTCTVEELPENEALVLLHCHMFDSCIVIVAPLRSMI